MNYAEARAQIRSGDLIAVRSHHAGLAWLTAAVTRSPYTHTAVAVWLADRLLVAEMRAGGDVLVPASRYLDSDLDVFPCPVEPVAAIGALFDLLGMDIGYELADLLRIAGHELLGIALPPRDEGGLICSALSASIYLHAGWRPADLPSIPAPRDVVAALACPPRLEVRS